MLVNNIRSADLNYTSTEERNVSVVYAFKNSVLPHLGQKMHSVCGNHSTVISLCKKKIQRRDCSVQVLLFIEFQLQVIDTKGAENLVVDHLSRLENTYENVLNPKEINENFPLETLNMVTFRGDSSTPWFSDYANYNAGNFIVKGMSSQ
ncbi:hypothetical protein Tco_0720551 [Tanacetum coccineum]